MTKLTCIAVVTLVVASCWEEAATQSHTHAQDDEILHTVCASEGVLTQCRNMCIVRKTYCESDSVSQHSSQWHYTLPRQVGGILDTAWYRTCTWRANTYRSDGLVTSICLNQCYNLIAKILHKVVHIWIIVGWEMFLGNNVSTDVHNGVGCTLITDVNTYHFCFNLIFFHIV